MTIEQIQEIIKAARTMHEDSWWKDDNYADIWYSCFLIRLSLHLKNCERVGIPKE